MLIHRSPIPPISLVLHITSYRQTRGSLIISLFFLSLFPYFLNASKKKRKKRKGKTTTKMFSPPLTSKRKISTHYTRVIILESNQTETTTIDVMGISASINREILNRFVSILLFDYYNFLSVKNGTAHRCRVYNASYASCMRYSGTDFLRTEEEEEGNYFLLHRIHFH